MAVERAAAHAVLSNEYLLEHITSYLPRRDQASCIRVNSRFFDAAGRNLYRIPPTIDADNIVNFFSGALIGYDLELETEIVPLECDGRKCPKKAKAKDGDQGKKAPPAAGAGPDLNVEQASPESLAVPSNASPTSKDPSSSTSTPSSSTTTAVDGASSGEATPPKARNDTLGHAEGDSPTKKKKKKKGKKSPSSIKYKKNRRKKSKAPTQRNFKEQLLSYVRVFSLGTHHSCICEHYAEWYPLLNVDILRVVPHFVKQFELEKLCDGEALCPLLTSIHCTKLVIRNLDFKGLQIPNDDKWIIPDLKEVVYFIPTDARKLDGSEHLGMDLWEMSDYFTNAASVKVVLCESWELDGKPYKRGFMERLMHGEPTMDPDTFLYLSQSLFTYADTKYLAIGLERVTWAPEGDMTHCWLATHPGEKLDSVSHYARMSAAEIRAQQQKMTDFVKLEVNQGTLWEWLNEFEPKPYKETNEFPDHVAFQDLSAYLADRSGRRGEICATD